MAIKAKKNQQTNILALDEYQLSNFNTLASTEWLETNGLGGYASGTIANCNTRRYHGLLVAATTIPTGRTVLVSKLDETIICNDKRTELGCNNYNGNIAPEGYQYIKAFSKGLYPEWVYEVDKIKLKKSILQLNGKNTTIIKYEVIEADSEFQISFKPFITARDYHSLWQQNNALHWNVDFKDGLFHNQPFGNDLNIFINIPGSSYQHNPSWYYNFTYQEEINRGLECSEDLLNHGEFEVSLKVGDVLSIILSTENPEKQDAEKLFVEEVSRRLALIGDKKGNELAEQLTLAADQFIVKRNIHPSNSDEVIEGASIIAGYHWFTDWGRDTMISLPGLCICTGRMDDAKKIIQAFANSVDKGMLPNFFSDGNGVPEYNNVDGTLWYFNAVYHYYNAADDENKAFILRDILPVLENMIDWHYKGTRYNIKVDPIDNLLYAGEKGQQLTWMDARVGNYVVTPRMGKPVEIVALWYNALRIVSELNRYTGNTNAAEYNFLRSQLVKSSFEKYFWNTQGEYLYDTLDEHNLPDDTFRPNQLFAISLPFALVDGERAKIILAKIKAELYTPVGLRSLAPGHPDYHGTYGGNQWDRDTRYHQGTVWSWLLGPYIDALVNVNTPKEELNKIILDFSFHLKEAGIGTVSEIFDGDAPYYPKGCIAQAWGVAEILRVITNYKLLQDE